MSKSGTWPGGVAMESLSNMDSAGSCDSVISVNSGYSDDSMEHLSAEERACLMYLEETIEALEVQEDSGLSNDEPDASSKAEKKGMDQMRVNDTSSLTSESGSHVVSLPLVQVAPDPAPEKNFVNQTSELQCAPASAANLEVPEAGDLVARPDTSTAASAAAEIVQSSVDPTEVLGLALEGESDADSFTNTEPCPGLSTEASEIDLGIIPPPSDFMDEPDTPSHPEDVEDVLPPAEISTEPETMNDLLQAEDPALKTSEGSSLTEDPPNKPPPVTTSNPQMSYPPGVPEPRSPPAVAPKPKKLPPNIILKSHKTAGAGSDGNSGHLMPINSDRALLDPQRVRIEALRKLGLLKSNEEDASPSLSPKLPPKTRQSWAASSPPISPATAQTPPTTPFYTPVNSPPPASVPLQPASPTAISPLATSATAPPIQVSDVLPAPAAFRDLTGLVPSNNELSAVKNVTEATIRTPPRTPPALVKQLTPPKVPAIKSATLERSGLGLSSYLTRQSSMEAGQGISSEQSPRQLRNSRPRPYSLGSGKDFSPTKVEDLQTSHATSKEPDSPKSQTGFQYSRESAKLPRSQGISVLICPRSENGENRREALKKLGLLRD